MPLISQHCVLDFSGKAISVVAPEAVLALAESTGTGSERHPTPQLLQQHSTPQSSKPREYLGMGGDKIEIQQIPLMGPLPRKKTGDVQVFHPNWALTKEDMVMGEIRTARELMKDAILPHDWELVKELPTPSLISGTDTLAAYLRVYMENLKQRVEKTVKHLSKTDQRLHQVEEQRDDIRVQLRAKEQEISSMASDNIQL